MCSGWDTVTWLHFLILSGDWKKSPDSLLSLFSCLRCKEFSCLFVYDSLTGSVYGWMPSWSCVAPSCFSCSSQAACLRSDETRCATLWSTTFPTLRGWTCTHTMQPHTPGHAQTPPHKSKTPLANNSKMKLIASFFFYRLNFLTSNLFVFLQLWTSPEKKMGQFT